MQKHIRFTMTWLTTMQCLCHKWPRICSTCRKHFPVLSSVMTYHGFVTRLTPVELLSLPEHLGSPPVFSGVLVTRSLVLCVCFVDRCLSFCTFFSWPLCCLFFFDLQILVIPLVFSNSSNRYTISTINTLHNCFFPQYYYGMISNTTLLYIQSDKS